MLYYAPAFSNQSGNYYYYFWWYFEVGSIGILIAYALKFDF